MSIYKITFFLIKFQMLKRLYSYVTYLILNKEHFCGRYKMAQLAKKNEIIFWIYRNMCTMEVSIGKKWNDSVARKYLKIMQRSENVEDIAFNWKIQVFVSFPEKWPWRSARKIFLFLQSKVSNLKFCGAEPDLT